MMVQNSVLIKIALIDAGRDNRQVCYIDSGDNVPLIAKRFLNTDMLRLSSGLAPYGDQIAAKVYTGILDALCKQIFF